MYVICLKLGSLTAFLRYLPDVTGQEVPYGIKLLLQIDSINADLYQELF